MAYQPPHNDDPFTPILIIHPLLSVRLYTLLPILFFIPAIPAILRSTQLSVILLFWISLIYIVSLMFMVFFLPCIVVNTQQIILRRTVRGTGIVCAFYEIDYISFQDKTVNVYLHDGKMHRSLRINKETWQRLKIVLEHYHVDINV